MENIFMDKYEEIEHKPLIDKAIEYLDTIKELLL